MAPGKGIDYSKWDNIDDSDEEDAGDAKPPSRADQVRCAACRCVCVPTIVPTKARD